MDFVAYEEQDLKYKILLYKYDYSEVPDFNLYILEYSCF